MDDEKSHYILNNCKKVRKMKIEYSILVVHGDPMYIREDIQKDDVEYIDNKVDKKFDSFLELKKHVEAL